VKRTPVHSSVLHAVGYDSKTATLEVEFSSKLIYRYRRVPRAKFTALLNAPSKGRYFNANIRDYYSYVALQGPTPA
jgi:hypothetical protein